MTRRKSESQKHGNRDSGGKTNGKIQWRKNANWWGERRKMHDGKWVERMDEWKKHKGKNRKNFDVRRAELRVGIFLNDCGIDKSRNKFVCLFFRRKEKGMWIMSERRVIIWDRAEGEKNRMSWNDGYKRKVKASMRNGTPRIETERQAGKRDCQGGERGEWVWWHKTQRIMLNKMGLSERHLKEIYKNGSRRDKMENEG